VSASELLPSVDEPSGVPLSPWSEGAGSCSPPAGVAPTGWPAGVADEAATDWGDNASKLASMVVDGPESDGVAGEELLAGVVSA
jgi:hypothetical protein